MRFSIVIPVWNGASVIGQCLHALHAHSGDGLLETICVDNASRDDSAAVIAQQYPGVRLVRQPANLGFAGGVNAGIDLAQGEVFVLLNQDCLVEPGWLAALRLALQDYPDFGILGCTLLSADGTVHQAGAVINRPDARGLHLTSVGGAQVREADYVTGAAFAIRRVCWDAVGRFDEGYYPAYYEDSDYCYRARRKGFGVGYVPQARVEHLLSNREWQVDPIKHAINTSASRYRFVSKHFDSDETRAFFAAEAAALEAERYFSEAVGRMLAARDTLRGLADILERRRLDLGEDLPLAQRRQLQVGFTQVMRQAFAVTQRLGRPYWDRRIGEPPGAEPATAESATRPPVLPLPSEPSSEEQSVKQRLDALRHQEEELLAQLRSASPADGRIAHWMRRLLPAPLFRAIAVLVGQDYFLRASRLATIHKERADLLEQYQQDRADRRLRCIEQHTAQQAEQMKKYVDEADRLCYERTNERLKVFEALADYDYR